MNFLPLSPIRCAIINVILLFRFDISGPDYSQGIFQSIGFKEFHAYLNLDPEQRDSEQGRTEFSKGVQLLKTATRQYAR